MSLKILEMAEVYLFGFSQSGQRTWPCFWESCPSIITRIGDEVPQLPQTSLNSLDYSQLVMPYTLWSYYSEFSYYTLYFSLCLELSSPVLYVRLCLELSFHAYMILMNVPHILFYAERKKCLSERIHWVRSSIPLHWHFRLYVYLLTMS